MTKNTKNTFAGLAMQKAWKLARKAQTLYGGSVREFFNKALQIAWAELNSNGVVQAIREIIAETRAAKAAGTFHMGRQSRYRAAYYAAAW
jgi:hypothetical protein